MNIIRTPEERFLSLPDYPFTPNYIELENGLRMHYVDEGPKGAKPILMMHGEPSWSYLYRFMIPICVKAGHRVIAPDLIGFGKSDKLTKVSDYSYANHVTWITQFIKAMNLNEITLVCQDWGSLIGLRVAAENEERYARIILGNGFLPTGEGKIPLAFYIWKYFAIYSPFFPIGKIMSIGSKRKLAKEEIAAYDAPFPNKKYKAGARAFPALVPVTPSDPASPANIAAWEIFKKWNKPFVTCFSTGDPVTKGGDKVMQNKIPGAKGMPHIRVSGGHFLQEDSPHEFANKVNEVIALTS
jgi:haloalkane dehalogenase